MTEAGVMHTAVPLSRYRTVKTVEVQTEESFVPSCIDLKYAYDPMASEQFSDLKELRDLIRECMEDMVGSVYDFVGFKDVFIKVENEFPSSLPVTDILLLSSKLFRKTSELGRLIGCFFGVVFAEDHEDEHFNFGEVRILQRELKEVRRRLEVAEKEKEHLEKMLANVGQVALDHGKAVELLEDHNRALQLQTSALEDQMALLFHQINADLEENCKDALEKVSAEMEMHERMNPAHTAIRQTMDSITQQVVASRNLLSDVRNTLMSCNQGMKTGEAYTAVEPSVRFKLKMLDSNFQQVVGRFSSIKDTLAGTAHELMTALNERKKILYLSYQHIRLYDLQNSKVRRGKAVIAELRNFMNDLLFKIQATFPSGRITSVDRIGRFTTQQWQGGYTLAALRQMKAKGGKLPDDALPGLTPAERMAAESELAAFSDENFISSKYGDNYAEWIKKKMKSEGAMTEDGEVNAEPFENVHVMLDLVRIIDEDIDKLSTALNLEDEMSAFLKTLTLSASTTARTDIDGDNFHSAATAMEHYEGAYEQALNPTGSQPPATISPLDVAAKGDADRTPDGTPPGASPSAPAPATPHKSTESRITKAEQAQADAMLARQAQQLQKQQEQLSKIQDEFSTKLGFLRQVYEARIGDLEVKESNAKATTSKARLGVVKEKEYAIVRAGSNKLQDEEMQKLKKKSDREELLQVRGEWSKTRPGLHAQEKLRERTATEIEALEQKIEQKKERRRMSSISPTPPLSRQSSRGNLNDNSPGASVQDLRQVSGQFSNASSFSQPPA